MFKRTHSRRATDTRAAYQAQCFVVPLLAGAGLCAFALDVRADEPTVPVYETVVKASPNAFVSQEDVAASTSIVSRDRTPRTGESVEQLVGELPGVAVTRFGGTGATSTISVRGSTANQVEVYVDDIPVNLATGGGVDLGFLPIASTSRIELFKGSSPIAYGSSGIGGILALTTEIPVQNAIRGALGIGSWGSRSLNVAGSYVLPRIRAFVSMSTIGWKGDFNYETDNGVRLTSNKTQREVRANNDLSQQDAVMRLILPLAVGRTLSFVASLDQREQGIPGYGLLKAQFPRLNLTRHTAQIAYEGSHGVSEEIHLRGNLYLLRIGRSFADQLGEYGARTDTNDTHWAVGTTWRASRALGFGLRIKAIGTARHEEFLPTDSLQTQPAGPPGTRDTAAVGIEPSYVVVRTRSEIALTGRLEGSRDVLSVRSMFTNAPSATAPKTTLLPVVRMSLSQPVGTHLVFRANLGRYVRAPSTTERYGNTGYILPNPLLDPEHGTNTDLGARFSFQRAGFNLPTDASIFASWVQDLIQFKQSAQGKARAYNTGSAAVKGVEAAATMTAVRHLKLFAQTTYTHAIDTSATPSTAGKQLPFRPAQRAYGRPEVVNLRLGGNLLAGFYCDVDFTNSNYLDSANLVLNASRLLFGFGAHVLHKASGIRAVLSANNLGDIMAYDYTGFPLPGRSVFLSLDWLTSFSDNSNSIASEGAS